MSKLITTAYKLQGSDLHLVRSRMSAAESPVDAPPTQPTHHVLVLDCSGSMADSHPKMRAALAEKLYTMVGEGDSVSVIWFSGRGEHGVVVERAQLPTLREVERMKKLFDRWIKPIGLTGFKEPLTDVRALLSNAGKGARASLFFLSDGCDNQWGREEILKEIDSLAPSLSAATIVEYGYYADRVLLTKMAERFGGSLVFAEDFVNYEPLLEDSITCGAQSGPTADVEAPDALLGVAFSLSGRLERVQTYQTAGSAGLVSVFESSLEPAMGGGLYFLTKTPPKGVPVETCSTSSDIAALYAALAVYSARMAPEVVLPILRDLGDVRFIKRYGSLFGKQAYTEFMEEATGAIFSDGMRGVDGFDRNAVPADDAFTVVDLLTLLAGEQCSLLLDHPSFSYSRISRKRIDATEGEQLKFTALKCLSGYSIANLTWNEDRANVSVLVQRFGEVGLTGRLPFKGVVPEKFPTFQWRNYAIVKDGMRNVNVLPVHIPKASSVFKVLEERGVPFTTVRDESIELDATILDLSSMPVVNRAQVERASAKELFEAVAALEELRAKNKVYKSYLVAERRSDAWDAQYGKEAADWLKEQGLTQWGGFTPPATKQVEARDYYLSKVMEVKIKGWSSLPSVKDVTSGKSKNGPAMVMLDAVNEVEKKKAALGSAFPKWIASAQDAIEQEVRAGIRTIAKAKFALLIAGTWFKEFASIDEKAVLPVKIGGKTVDAEVVLSEEKVLL